VDRLQQAGTTHFAPANNESLAGRPLGHAIYCVGYTADFRLNPFETVEAHVGYLSRVLRKCDFDSLTYLSSARVYRGSNALAHEEDSLRVNSLNRDDLYNISKLMGESLAQASGKKIRIVRLSNVYGADFNSSNFLATVLGDVITTGRVVVHSGPHAEKDYVSLEDVVTLLSKIAVGGNQTIYNLASGTNVSNQALMQNIAELTGCEVVFGPAAVNASAPRINIDRLRSEFGFRPRCLLDDLADLIEVYKKHYQGRTGAK
jgi:nucleoside-diphosphate-sugar epimerase